MDELNHFPYFYSMNPQRIYFLLNLAISFFRWTPYGLYHYTGKMVGFVLAKTKLYRKDIVLDNLKRSFPENEQAENMQLLERFFKHFGLMVSETLVALAYKPIFFKKRCVFLNPEILPTNQSAILLTAHFGNWEWGTLSLPQYVQHHTVGIYKHLKNRTLDEWIKGRRARGGMEMVEMALVLRKMINLRKTPTLYTFIADQTPFKMEGAQWTEFLHQDTPFYTGPEKLAAQFDYPVYYVDIFATSQGHYSLEFVLLEKKPKGKPAGWLVPLYVKHLEKTIRRAPEYWLWSHRRWKRTRE